jgi:hypothetical protein
MSSSEMKVRLVYCYQPQNFHLSLFRQGSVIAVHSTEIAGVEKGWRQHLWDRRLRDSIDAVPRQAGSQLDQVSALWDRVLGRLKAFVED